ncbi:hypothetical protein C8Q72DRAFT_798380 [Fomitopsis betulina]|nr:hypothetical protein C8Q72DRAFT_798380 [Fomitopsis betulina]
MTGKMSPGQMTWCMYSFFDHARCSPLSPEEFHHYIRCRCSASDTGSSNARSLAWDANLAYWLWANGTLTFVSVIRRRQNPRPIYILYRFLLLLNLLDSVLDVTAVAYGPKKPVFNLFFLLIDVTLPW